MLRDDALLKEEMATTWMARLYHHKVKERPLKEGDLVLKNI